MSKREELVELLRKEMYPQGFKGYHPDSVKEVDMCLDSLADAVMEWHEKRLEPLRLLLEKYDDAELDSYCAVDFYRTVKSVIE